jgi:hypothetical protein
MFVFVDAKWDPVTKQSARLRSLGSVPQLSGLDAVSQSVRTARGIPPSFSGSGFHMFERTLADLIRGLRASKKDDAVFIAKAIEEIRNEVKSKDMELKAAAILKLTFVRPVIVTFHRSDLTQGPGA